MFAVRYVDNCCTLRNLFPAAQQWKQIPKFCRKKTPCPSCFLGKSNQSRSGKVSGFIFFCFPLCFLVKRVNPRLTKPSSFSKFNKNIIDFRGCFRRSNTKISCAATRISCQAIGSTCYDLCFFLLLSLFIHCSTCLLSGSTLLALGHFADRQPLFLFLYFRLFPFQIFHPSSVCASVLVFCASSAKSRKGKASVVPSLDGFHGTAASFFKGSSLSVHPWYFHHAGMADCAHRFFFITRCS